jgi:acetoin utilization deacetylase AcuC-like enzyme
MKIYYSDHFTLPLPEDHRFPLTKYALLRQRVSQSGLFGDGSLIVPEPATEEQLTLAHLSDYVQRVLQGELTEKEIRRIGFPWSPGLVERSRRSVGGTIAACRSALQDSISANLAGGTHHAYADHGEGYCVFNDCAVAARVMQAEGRAQRVVILDCDVHQGNGTASIFSADPSVFTFSIHAAKNFPFHKEPSDLDIALADGVGDEDYLAALEEGARHAIQASHPDLAIYLAGADPFLDDRLGRLALTKEGLAQRDNLIFGLCHQAGIPVAVTLSGGYARLVEDTVDIHFHTIQLAAQLAKNRGDPLAS